MGYLRIHTTSSLPTMKYVPCQTPHYFSIDDIFATQERIPCKFAVNVPGLGFLDPSSESENIETGTSLELPFWLAQSLSAQRRHIVTVDLPKIFKETYRDILKADPCVVDLNKLSLFFYEFGKHVVKLKHRDSTAIATVLTQTFKDRFRRVMDWAHNSGTDPTIAQTLGCLEKKLFLEGQHTQNQMEAWLNEDAGQITAADMVVNHKKRKLIALDEF